MAELTVSAKGKPPVIIDGRVASMVLALLEKRRQISECDAVQVTFDYFSKNQDLKMKIGQHFSGRELDPAR